MKLAKNKNLKYLFVGIIIILIFFLSTVKSFGQEQYQEPYTFDFENNSILDIDQEYNPEYYNIRNQTEYLGNYDAEFSFENDIGKDENSNLDFVDSYGYGTYDILSSYEGHSSVLDIRKTTFFTHYLQNNLEKDFEGIYEFWTYIVEPDSATLRFHESGTRCIDIYFHNNGSLVYQDGSGYHTIEVMEYANWTQYSIQWFPNNTFDIYKNGLLLMSDLEFLNDMTNGLDSIRFQTGNNYNQYFDGLDYDKSGNYEFNRNLLPKCELTGILEVDKYEFDYSYDGFENDYYVWQQGEKTGSANDIQVLPNTNQDTDKYIDIFSWYGAIYNHYIDYTSLDLDSMVLNLTFEIEISTDAPDFKHEVYIEPKNRNGGNYIMFKFDGTTGNFAYFNNTLDAYEVLFEYDVGTVYYINIYLNYYDNIMVVRINSDTDNGIWIFDLEYDDWHDLYGLTYLGMYNYCYETVTPSGFETKIYSVGIYEYGYSIIENDDYDFGLMSYELDDSWNSDNHNLLTIDSENTFKLFAYTDYDYFRDGYLVKPYYTQTELEIINLQDSKDNNYPKFIYNTAYLIFQVFGNCTNMYEIEIEGIRLINQDNIYVYGNYYYNYSNPLNNWFYVVDNKLFYNFNDSNSVIKETMRITFNIDDILLINESLISYSSYITNNYDGYIYLSSYYSTETFSISNNESIVNTYVNITDLEHFTLKEISIEINTNSISENLTEGYIQNLNIYPTKPLFPDFEPIEYLDSTFLEKMIETIIPMLFFIVPSFIMKTKYGNKAVLPIWILMTFIFLIANFIPFWICFIIFLSIGLMIMNKDEVMD